MFPQGWVVQSVRGLTWMNQMLILDASDVDVVEVLPKTAQRDVDVIEVLPKTAQINADQCNQGHATKCTYLFLSKSVVATQRELFYAKTKGTKGAKQVAFNRIG